jgi:hypothetical protein
MATGDDQNPATGESISEVSEILRRQLNLAAMEP